MLSILGILWFVFGVGAIITAGLNVIWTMTGKNSKWLCFISLSLTALTLCSFYSQASIWVLRKDWSALQDVVPSVSVVLWVLTLISIALNGFFLIKSTNR